MKHFPAVRHAAHLTGLEHTRAPWSASRFNVGLALATAFAAGFCAAVYSVGWIVTAP